ncbi:hypothetical protein BK816_07340 [Boudabousia tangfeifanii]|uniref:beta-N-acetylhexosaminidase n=1 Tax=Boudabousia tangfeifanii TaxID=1912795 RepID=A0A1D9MLE9_9ACTO|nr:hypothetical protein BK816_07340 [Boudabousia tangfeifanii]
MSAVALLTAGASLTAPLAQAAPQPASPVVAETPTTNVAVNVAAASNGGRVTTSGREVQEKWGPEKLIDGVINPEASGAEESRWSSNYDDNAWATVTFREASKLDHVNLHWETACPKKWDLLLKAEGSEDFVKVASSDAQECPVKHESSKFVFKLSGEQAEKKYTAMKLQVRERTPIGGRKWGASLWEMEAWTGPEPAPAPTPANRDSNYGLVPLPAHLEETAGQSFTLTDQTKIVAPSDLANEANLLAQSLRTATGFPLPVVETAEGNGNITLRKGTVEGYAGKPEAYSLVTTPDGVTITGVSNHGVFNGTATLRQLFPGFINMKQEVIKDWVAPAVQIKDAPRYSYRGVGLDIARSFVPKEDIEKLIDNLAMFKMSVLHLHLADDQGWRIEITNEGRADGDDIDYTKLTEVSGKTAMWAHEKQSSREQGRTGYLTQQDYKDLQEYAAKRHIEIIPEIDVPGHTNAAVHAIPQLNTPGSHHAGTEQQPTSPANGTGAVGWSYLDPESPATDAFLKHVFGQLAGMTKSNRIHIGGDEPHQFEHRYGQAKYNAFLGKVLDIVHNNNKTALGWNEISNATTLREGDIMHYWTGSAEPTKRAIRNRNAKVLLSKPAESYLDQKYTSKTPLALNWACQGNCDFPRYYNWNPKTFLGMGTDDPIVGTEAVLWSETVRGLDQVEFLTFMRALSHAEIGWTPQDLRNLTSFKKRVAEVAIDLNSNNTNFYDGPATEWNYDVAGVKSTALTTGSNIQLGYLSAPGTKLADNGKKVVTDTVNDEDGTSKSKVGEGKTVEINWGDGSPVENATLTPKLARSAYNASSLYAISATHTFATAGEKDVTLTIGDKTVKAKVNVVESGTPTAPIFQPWQPTGQPKVVSQTEYAVPAGRLKLHVENFEPNKFAEVTLGKYNLGQIRPDTDGTRDMFIYVLPDVPAGVYDLKVTQGDKVATTKVTIWGPETPKLQNPIDGLTVAAYSSQAENETAPNGFATAAIDGDVNTFWHTRWADPADHFPHFISLNLNKTCKVDALQYFPRKGNTNTRIKDYEVYVSADGQNWGEAVAKGSFKAGEQPQVVSFDAKPGNFVKLVGLNSHNGDDFAGAGEIMVGGLCGEQTGPALKVTAPEVDQEVAEDGSTTVTVEPGANVTFKLENGPDSGQISVWTYDDHQVLAYTDLSAEKQDVTIEAPAAGQSQKLVVVTPAGRFVVTVKAEKKPEPTPEPTKEPTPEPTKEPTVEPTVEPTPEPTKEPTPEPTKEPTVEPTKEPTVEPTPEVTKEPTPEPTKEPTPEQPKPPVKPEPTKEPAPKPQPPVKPTPEQPKPPVKPEPTPVLPDPKPEPKPLPPVKPQPPVKPEPTPAPVKPTPEQPKPPVKPEPTKEPAPKPQPPVKPTPEQPKPPVKPEPTPAPKPPVKPEPTPAPKPPVKPEPTPVLPDPKPEPKPLPPVKPKPPVKPEPTKEPAPVPAPKPDPTPVKPEPKPVPKPVPVKPVPVPVKPAPKPEPEVLDPFLVRASVPVFSVAKDVPSGALFAGEIKWMYEAGITTGFNSDQTFRPAVGIDREAMAAFLYRLAGRPDVKGYRPVFKDVDQKRTLFWREIQWMHDAGISTGWADGTYRPYQPVNRDAMAAFMYRFCAKFEDKCSKHVNPNKLVVNEPVPFKDVNAKTLHHKAIAWMRRANISTGWADGTYRPVQPIERRAMAAFIFRMVHNGTVK